MWQNCLVCQNEPGDIWIFFANPFQESISYLETKNDPKLSRTELEKSHGYVVDFVRCYLKYGITRKYEDETGESQPDARAAQRAMIHRVKSEYERFDCISDTHKFGVKVQQLMWTETSAEINGLADLASFWVFCSRVLNEHQGPNARESFSKRTLESVSSESGNMTKQSCPNAHQTGPLVLVCLSTVPTAVDRR